MKHSIEDFTNIVRNSYSIRQILIQLNLIPAGGNYATVKRKIRKLGLDCSHFTGQGHLKGKKHTWAKKTPLEQILVKDSDYAGGSHKLKNKLLKAGIFDHKCYECELTEWRHQPISLELEHINGKATDNRIDNLTLLCPNCHSLTPTYRGKNKKK